MSASQRTVAAASRRDWTLLLAATITLAAMLVYPILQAVGFSPLRPQIVAAVLVFSFTAGIGISSRRYE